MQHGGLFRIINELGVITRFSTDCDEIFDLFGTIVICIEGCMVKKKNCASITHAKPRCLLANLSVYSNCVNESTVMAVRCELSRS